MIWNPLRWLTYFHPDSLGAHLVAFAFAVVGVGGFTLLDHFFHFRGDDMSLPMQRIEEGRWATGKDGLPIRTGAAKDCKTCDGHGVIEDGSFHYASVLMDCPDCFPETKDLK